MNNQAPAGRARRARSLSTDTAPAGNDSIQSFLPTEGAAQPRADGGLREALYRAQMAVDGVEKNARNEFHKYDYTSAEGMIRACRKALHEHGIMFARTGWVLSDDGQTVTSHFEMHHIGGEDWAFSIPWLVVVEKGRPIDKAMAGALTTCLSYFLRDLLLLPREEAGAMDTRNDERGTSTGWRQDREQGASGTAKSINQRLQAGGQQRPQAGGQQAPKAAQAVAPSMPAAPAAPQRIDATVKRLYEREASGKKFLVAELVDADGLATSAVVHEDIQRTARTLVGKTVCCVLHLRGDRMPQWMSVEEADSGAPNTAAGAGGKAAQEGDDDLPI